MSNQINTAAITLFEQFGNNFTLDQLSQNSNLSRATVYRRIGSKEALLKNLAKQGLINFDEQTDIKTRILAATRVVVVKHGFINCTMEQIAKQAELGIATLYRHFAEKEKLLLAYVSSRKSAFDVEYEINLSTSLEEGLEALIKTMFGFISENDDLIKMMFFGSPEERKYIRELRKTSGGKKSTFSLIAEFLTKHQQAGKIRTDISVQDMAASLVGQILQFSITSPNHFNRPLNIEKDAKTITQIFCHGL